MDVRLGDRTAFQVPVGQFVMQAVAGQIGMEGSAAIGVDGWHFGTSNQVRAKARRVGGRQSKRQDEREQRDCSGPFHDRNLGSWRTYVRVGHMRLRRLLQRKKH
jgi:hypothetical protein